MNFSLLIYSIVGIFWIFVLWMAWKAIQALRAIDVDLREIARSLNQRQQ